jgi:AraC family transcriptional regulator
VQTSAQRFDVATGSRTKFDVQAVTLQDTGIWPGLRLEQWEGQGGELPETILFQHGFLLNLETSHSTEVQWSGHQRCHGDFAAGSFGIFPAGIPYRGGSKGRTLSLAASLSPAFLQSVAGASRTGPIELTPGNGLVDGFISEAFHALAADVRESSPFGPMYGESIAVALAAHLTRHYSADPRIRTERLSAADHKRTLLKQFIFERLEQSLSLAEMAAFSQLDPYSFAHWFKAAFGVPPHQYVLLARIERAKSLLAKSSISLVGVALQCGFSSQSHLSNTFRKFVGISPKVYRKTAGGPSGL